MLRRLPGAWHQRCLDTPRLDCKLLVSFIQQIYDGKFSGDMGMAVM